MRATLLVLTLAFSSISGENTHNKNDLQNQRDKKCTRLSYCRLTLFTYKTYSIFVHSLSMRKKKPDWDIFYKKLTEAFGCIFSINLLLWVLSVLGVINNKFIKEIHPNSSTNFSVEDFSSQLFWTRIDQA